MLVLKPKNFESQVLARELPSAFGNRFLGGGLLWTS